MSHESVDRRRAYEFIVMTSTASPTYGAWQRVKTTSDVIYRRDDYRLEARPRRLEVRTIIQRRIRHWCNILGKTCSSSAKTLWKTVQWRDSLRTYWATAIDAFRVCEFLHQMHKRFAWRHGATQFIGQCFQLHLPRSNRLSFKCRDGATSSL